MEQEIRLRNLKKKGGRGWG